MVRACALLCVLAGCPEKKVPPTATPLRPSPPPLDLSRVERISGEAAFGAAVAIDGDVLVVGAPGPLLSKSPGAVFVHRREGRNWKRIAKLTGDCRGLGSSVAISGNVLIAGGRNCALVFQRADEGWKELARWTGEGDNFFGERVAIEGDEAVVADSWNDVGNARQAGSVFVYRRAADGWKAEAPVSESPPSWGATFGSDFSLRGGTLAIGARQLTVKPDAGQPGVEAAGALSLFERKDGAWREVFHFQGDQPFATVGHSVAADGSVALAGSQGGRRAFVFERLNGRWQVAGSLDAPEREQGRENFCASLALRGDDAAIGAIPLSSDSTIPLVPGTNRLDGNALVARRGPSGGKVHLYQRGPERWRFVTTLAHPASSAGDEFGHAIAFGRDALAVGAPGLGEVVVFSSP
jgi:hypothetical protein